MDTARRKACGAGPKLPDMRAGKSPKDPRYGAGMSVMCLALCLAAMISALPLVEQLRAQAAQPEDLSLTDSLLKGDWGEMMKLAAGQKRVGKDTAVANWLMGYAGIALDDYSMAATAFGQLQGQATANELLRWSEALAKPNPGNPAALMLKGDALARTGMYRESLAALDDAIKADPRRALLYDVRGVVRATTGDLIAAKDDFQKALELKPAFPDAMVNLGLLYMAMEDFHAALDALNHAVEASPGFAMAFNARGVLYAHLEAWDMAEADFRRAEKLAPGVRMFPGNLSLVAWASARTKLRESLVNDDPEKRGMALVAMSYDRYSVDIGDGRTVDVIRIKNTPLTATQDGMTRTIRSVVDDLRAEAGLPQDWKPGVLVAQYGLGSRIEIDRVQFAKTAAKSGHDLVFSVDMSDKFQWDTRALRIDAEASRRVERLVVAANEVSGKPCDAMLGSQATRLVVPGRFGSETLSDLRLDPKFAINRLVVVGVPLPGLALADRFRDSCIKGGVMAITTPPVRADLIESAPLKGASSAEVRTWEGKPVGHGSLFRNVWPNGQLNPASDLAAQHFRGASPSAIQRQAEAMTSGPMVYKSFDGNPLTVHVTMASMTRRGLTDPYAEKVLIGCPDAKVAEAMKAQFAGWQARTVPTNDLARLREMARAEGFTHINVVLDRSQASVSTISDAHAAPPAALPQVRSLARNIDRFNDATRLVYKLAEVEMPAEMKVPLSFAGPVLQDLRSAGEGRFHPLTSQSLERIGKFGMQELPKVVDVLKQQGKLPSSFSLSPVLHGLPDIAAGLGSQVGRGKMTPSVDEVTHYLDGVNKASWAVVGALVAGPKGASVASTAAGLTADVLRGATEPAFQYVAHDPVRKQMVADFRTHVEAAIGHGVQARTFTEMFTPQLIRQVGFHQSTVGELDSVARLANASAQGHSLSAPTPVVAAPVSIDIEDVRRKMVPFFRPPDSLAGAGYDDLRRKYFKPPDPPDKFGGAAVPTGNYRLPSGAIPDDKRGGVSMKTDVVKDQPADLSGMFGGEASTKSAAAIPEALLCPFLIFSAMPEAGCALLCGHREHALRPSLLRGGLAPEENRLRIGESAGRAAQDLL